MTIVFAQPIEQFPNHLKFSTVPTFSAGNPDAYYPASNMIQYDPTRVARTLTNTVTINWDFGMLRNFNIVSMLYSNVGPRAVWTVSASVDNTTFVTLVNAKPFWAHLTATPAAGPWAEDADPRKGSLERNHSWFYSLANLNYRYLRILVTDPDTTNMTFGRLFVGRAFQPSMHIQYGSSFSFDDTGSKERTDQGAQILLPGRSIVSAQLKMDFLSTNELYDYVWDFNYWRQGCREILCNIDPDTQSRFQKNILYATIAEGRRITADEFNAWSQTWILESI